MGKCMEGLFALLNVSYRIAECLKLVYPLKTPSFYVFVTVYDKTLTTNEP